MSHRFLNDLEQLKRNLLSMGAVAEGMLQKVSVAIMDRNSELLLEVREDENEINQLQREIDNEVVRLIVVFTPVAGDLRFLMMATRISYELERIGDQALNVCDHFDKLMRGTSPKPYEHLPKMVTIVQEMLHQSLDAFIERSEEKAIAVMKRDDEVDDLNDRIFSAHLADMSHDARHASTALGLILVARSFERVADLAVDIAEDVIYLLRGKDVRHVKTMW